MVELTKTQNRRSPRDLAETQDRHSRLYNGPEHSRNHGLYQRLYNRLGLRRRLALFFVAMVLGGSALTGLGLWVGHQRFGGPTEALVLAWIIATLGLAALGAWFGALFDEHVARPILDLTAELETRAHTDVRHEIDDRTARHLGALTPAARAVNCALAEARNAQARQLAKATEALEQDRSHLEALVQALPGAVIVVSDTGEILLADQAAQGCLGPIGLHRPLDSYLDTAPLRQAQDNLTQKDDWAIERVTLNRKQHSGQFHAQITRIDLGDQRLGFALWLENPAATEPSQMARQTALSYEFTATGAWGSQAALRDLPLVVFDTETTGLDARRDAVVQLSAVRIVQGRLQQREVFDVLINPGRRIPKASTLIHGITDDMVANAPSAAEVIADFRAFCAGSVLVAHNAPFDMQVLETAAPGWRDNAPPALCTARLSQQLTPHRRGHTLDDLIDRYDIELDEAARHTGLGDATATAGVFLRMLPLLEKSGLGTLSAARAFSDC